MGDLKPTLGIFPSLLHVNFLQKALGSNTSTTITYSYKHSFNGFVASLTNDEVKLISSMEEVVSVFPNGNNKLYTTNSWDFMGFPQNVKRAKIVESNMIIGIIDSGIWPESDSFKDTGFGPPPTKWKGSCRGLTNFTCNNKIIGARYYKRDGVFGEDDIESPRDSIGHGTHIASIVAGGHINLANIYGLAKKGTARGGVPSSRIAAYKVCWSDGCSNGDVLAAFDDAIKDGVDIISCSIGNGVYSEYFENWIDIGSFHAMRVGIMTSLAGGNDGSRPGTVTNASPWSLAVASCWTNRTFVTNLKLGNDLTFQGISVNPFYPNGYSPIVYGGKVAKSRSRCHVSKARNATIMRSNEVNEEFAPYVAIFSSKGPNNISPDILKPDLCAPGVNILAAWIPKKEITNGRFDKRKFLYNMKTGSSFACPQVSAIAAYVKSFHPSWSPAALKSALLTTASKMIPKRGVQNEFSYGAGHLNPIGALNPGLVYDANEANYIEFLCGQGYGIIKMQLITGEKISCKFKGQNAWNLNLPSFTYHAKALQYFKIVFNRTVTNVGIASSTYSAKIVVPPRLKIEVVPNTLSFSSVGQTRSFVLIVAGVLDKGYFVSTSLSWADGTHNVRSPIVIYCKKQLK